MSSIVSASLVSTLYTIHYTISIMDLHPENIICLPGGAGGRALTRSEYLSEGVIIMSTYEELSLIVSIALLIVAILNLKNKK